MTTELERPTVFIEKQEIIHAPTTRVFEILIKPEFTKRWMSGFKGGSWIEGNWDKDTLLVVMIGDVVYAKAKVIENTPNKLIKLQFYKRILKEDNQSTDHISSELSDFIEVFELVEQEAKTLLKVKAGPYKEQGVKDMSTVWDKCISLIKDISEKDNSVSV